MPEQEKETKETEKSEEKRPKTKDSGYGLKIALIMVGVVLILIAVGGATRFAFRGKQENSRFGRFAMMQGQSNEFGRQKKSGCPNTQEYQVGISGEITSISGDKLTVKTSTKDLTVNIVDETSITKNREVSAKSDLKEGDKISVRGSSNSAGEIVASLIRVQPS